MRNFARIAAATLFLLAGLPVQSADAALDEEVMDRVAAATVLIVGRLIVTENGIPRSDDRALGSGTVVSPDGWILTNGHVIHDAFEKALSDVKSDYSNRPDVLVEPDPASLFLVYTVDDRDDEPLPKYTAKVELDCFEGRECPDLDLAVLRVTGDANGNPIRRQLDMPNVALGNTCTAKTGDEVYVFGWPEFGAQSAPPLESPPIDAVPGTIRRLQYGAGLGDLDSIQVDATLSGGSSGGPVVNKDGDLIGIAKEVHEGTGGSSVEVIPINRITPFLFGQQADPCDDSDHDDMPEVPGVVGQTYTAPTRGYSISWDESWSVLGPGFNSTEGLQLSNGVSFVILDAFPSPSPSYLFTCAAGPYVQEFVRLNGGTDLVREYNPASGVPNVASQLFSFTGYAEDGETDLRMALYVECRWFDRAGSTQGSMLQIYHVTNFDLYERESRLVGQLLGQIRVEEAP